MTNKDLLYEIVTGRILYMVAQHLITCLGYVDSSEFKTTALCAVGSRIKGYYKENSDLDIALQYEGNMKEDVVFEVLNSDPLIVGGITVDFIPYSEYKGHSIYVQESYISLFHKKENEMKGTDDEQ